MTEQEALKKVQEAWKCDHMRVLGEACDINSGGWWTCTCAVQAWKMTRDNGDNQQRTVEVK